MENKKIKNATKTIIDGIEFKSSLEASAYKLFKEAGFSPEYESHTYELSKKIRPTVPFYKDINKNLELDYKPLSKITYTPDFWFEYNKFTIIVEIKGFPNDVYPVKRNLFRKYLESTIKMHYYEKPIVFFEVKSVKEIKQAIDTIKKLDIKNYYIRRMLCNLPEDKIVKALKLVDIFDYTKLINYIKSLLKPLIKNVQHLNYEDMNKKWTLETTINQIKEILNKNDDKS